MKNLISLGVFLLILLSVQVNAQEQSVLKIRPTGRILMDGGLFHSDNKNFVDGVAIPDARIGVKATYGKYKAKMDIGYRRYSRCRFASTSDSGILRCGHCECLQ